MVDPSVHGFHMNLSGRDESPGRCDFGPAGRESALSIYEGEARRQVRRSRSRTRRTSVDRAMRTSSSHKDGAPKYPSIPIENISRGESSSSTSSSGSESTSSTSSSSSSSDRKSMQPPPTIGRKSIPKNQSATSSSEDESIQESTKPISTGKSFRDTQAASSSSEDEPMQVSSGPTNKGNSTTENQSASSSSEDEPMQESPEPSSKGYSITKNQSASSSSEDESMQKSLGPTSKGYSTTENQAASSSSEDEPMQKSPEPSSKGYSIKKNQSASSPSEDESMQASPEPRFKGKEIPGRLSASSTSEDESIPQKATSKEESFPNNNATSSSKDESGKGNINNQTDLLELEDISSTPISEESPNEYFPLSNNRENALPEIDPKADNGQHRKELGDKLTVKFKVTLPEVGNGLIGGPVQFLRVPQFMHVESGAFDDQSFKDSMKPDDLKNEQARGDFLNRLKTTVRWRENQDKVKESNARIVRWSDGTETFHVGAEVFDVMHHKMTDDKNQLYVRLESCYQAQGSISDKMLLRPKLDSTFGQSHVQGLRNRAMNKPQTGVVKVISDLVADPMTDRQQRVKADLASLRKEERLKRREIQLSLRKPRVKPMRHCTADDSDMELVTGEQKHLETESARSVGKVGRNNTQGIRTNRNVAVVPGRLVSTDEEDDEDANDSDVNDIINDEELDYYEDGDDEEMPDEPRASTSKASMGQYRSSKPDSDEGPMTRTVKRKTKQLIYSDSSSD